MAYVLRFHLIRRIGYATFALGINLIPVIGVLIAAVILNERPDLRTALALALILGGLMIARLATAR